MLFSSLQVLPLSVSSAQSSQSTLESLSTLTATMRPSNNDSHYHHYQYHHHQNHHRSQLINHETQHDYHLLSSSSLSNVITLATIFTISLFSMCILGERLLWQVDNCTKDPVEGDIMIMKMKMMLKTVTNMVIMVAA